MIYLDSAATTPTSPIVVSKVYRVTTESWGNPSSRHMVGRKAREVLNEARRSVCLLIKGARPENIIFTSGGTEANNLAILGARDRIKYAPDNLSCNGPDILATPYEHKSVAETIRYLNKIDHTDPLYTPIQSGKVDLTPSFLKDLTILNPIDFASIMLVNNETGAINDVGAISRTLRELNPDILIHSDCVQAAGYLHLDVDKLGVDFLSISSHKIYGPKGVGALYVRDPKHFFPLFHGGSQEWGLRPGTENLASIAGFGAACRLADDARREAKMLIDENNYLLRCKLTSEVQGAHINRFADPWCDKILSVTFDGVDAETLMMLLDDKGVCVSAGAACNSLESSPSPALLASGLTEAQARSTIRISLSENLKVQEILEAARIIKECVEFLSAAK